MSIILIKDVVDPQYLTTDFDMTVLTATARGGRAIFADPRVAVSMTNEILPGAAVPANASDAQWAGYITAAYNVRNFRIVAGERKRLTDTQPVYHPIGTAAMMPQADGGAVDTAFKLYGVANVRVVGELPLSSRDRR
jgi:choline dehydrogenase-like flavoprotein